MHFFVNVKRRATRSFAKLAQAYHGSYHEAANSTWKPHNGTLVVGSASTTPRDRDAMLDTMGGQSYLAMAWAIFVGLDTSLVHTIGA